MTTELPVRAGVLDTSVIIALEHAESAGHLPEQAFITTVTLAELAVGPLVAGSEVERRARLTRLERVEARFQALPLNPAAAHAFGRVAASMRRAGRKPAARSFDALIAAIAVANGLPLYTCNPADFQRIDGLTIYVVPLPGSTDFGP